METKKLIKICECGCKMKDGQSECYKCRRTRKAVLKEAEREGSASNTGVNIAVEHIKRPGVVKRLFGIS